MMKGFEEFLFGIRDFVGDSPKELAVCIEARTGDPFRVLVSTLLSLRARDETTREASAKLLEVAPNAEILSNLSVEQIEKLIYPISFYKTKSKTLRNLSKIIFEKGGIPSNINGLLELKGIGRKSANLILTLGFGKLGICVDVHVHRILNRSGFLRTRNPIQTEMELRTILPEALWIPINDWLVTFGRKMCHPISPKCSTCPVSNFCKRTGVDRSR